MEKLRYKRSKIAAHTDSRSTCSQHSFRAPSSPATPLDNHQNRKCAKLSSNSSYSSSKTGSEDKILYRFGWKSSKRAPGTPIKELLSEEMPRETEIDRRSPNVIAKLMGLDELPIQRSSHRYQNKDLSKNHLQKTSVEKSRKRGILYDQRLSRSSSKDQQQFKDVFEVSEVVNMGSCKYSSQMNADFELTDSEVSSIEQNIADVKCLSADMSVQKSKESDDVLEVLDSNKDLLQRYVEQPNSLFTKHLNDLKATTFHSHCDHKESVMAIDAYRCENIDRGRKSDRTKLRLNYQKPHQQIADSLDKKFDRGLALSRSKSSDFQPLRRDQPAFIPTRIVVLKPNLVKVKDAINTASSPCTSQDILSVRSKHADFSFTRTQKADQEKKSSFDLHISRRCSKEPRDIAREITRQMKNSFNGSSVIFSPSTFTGYVGDESSCDFSGIESADEQVSIKNLRIRPTSRETSVTREARKRLSEQWKRAHKSKEVQILSRGSTLAEMLAVADKEPMSYCMIRGDNISNKFAMSNAPSRCAEPLGISSRDGWKDGCFQQLSRSKSLPSSSTILASPTPSLCREALRNQRHVITNDAVKGGRKKATDLDWKDGLRRHPKSGYKKSHSRLPARRVTYESSPDKYRSQRKVLNCSKESSQPKECLVSGGVDVSLKDTGPAPEILADVECENDSIPYEHQKKLSQETSSCIPAQGVLEHVEYDNLVQQEQLMESSNECSMRSQPTVTGLESPSSCKEADQPSPVSVLEPSFTDDMSSCSECFESLSADLQGLRMQLQLLKSENDIYGEGSMLIHCDEDGEASTGNSAEHGSCGLEDTWESSYVIDVLSFAGFADKSNAEWHCPNYSVNPSLFDELEKKYSDNTTCPRHERRLLFDRVNAGLGNIHPQLLEPRPWVSSPGTKICAEFIRERGHGSLPLLLANLENRVKRDTPGKLLTREAEWLDLGNEVDFIGREVETVVIDELIEEVFLREFF